MKKFTIVATALFIFAGIHAQQLPISSVDKTLTFKIIPALNNTWGYDIYNHDKLLIHQPSIPALPGNSGFTTKNDAEKVAKKIIEKINKGENPPSISIDEMKKLGVLEKKQNLH